MDDLTWHVYIVKCRDGTFYTGIARHLEARIKVHNAGKGAKYTAARRPVKLVYREEAASRSAAGRREWAIKKLTRAQKMALILESGFVPPEP